MAGVTDNRNFVNSLARGLEVIRAFSRTKPNMTLSEVAQETDLTRAAARRFLLTLVREGYAEANGRQFRLSPKVLELGYSVLASRSVVEVVQPVLDELAGKLDESCFAAVLDGDNVVYIARAVSRRVVNVGIDVGSRVAAHCVSTGRVLLAGLSEPELKAYLERVRLERYTPTTITSKIKLGKTIRETRRKGWSIVDQEFEIGLRSISVALQNRSGATVAALNVCCPSPRVNPGQMRTKILAELRDSATRISAAM